MVAAAERLRDDGVVGTDVPFLRALRSRRYTTDRGRCGACRAVAWLHRFSGQRVLHGDPVVHAEPEVVGMAREAEVRPAHAGRLLRFDETHLDVGDPVGRCHLRATVDDDLGEPGLGDGDGAFQRDAEGLGNVEADRRTGLFGVVRTTMPRCWAGATVTTPLKTMTLTRAVDLADDVLQGRLRRGVLHAYSM